MAQSPEHVISLLLQLSEKMQPKVAKEMEILKKEKMALEGNDTIEGWDKEYYMEVAKSKR